MTRKRILEILPIITAFANGSDIQYRLPGSTEDWKTWNEDKTVSPFNHDHWEFRVRPQPREYYIIYDIGQTEMKRIYPANSAFGVAEDEIIVFVREIL